MSIGKIIGTVVLVLVVVVILVAPIGPLPGFFIGGEDTATPSAWPETQQVHEIELEVPGSILPRVVVIWLVDVAGVIHVVGAQDSGWTQAIGNQSPVRMKLEGKTYSLQATRVSDGLDAILAAYTDKYRADYPDIVAGFSEMEDPASYAAVFKLE